MRKKTLYYLHYLDDIWGIWPHSEAEFQIFMETLNAHDPYIQLTSVLDKNTVDFLDTTVFKGPDFEKTGKLDVKVYFKPTDTHALLYKSSFHPKHTFRGLIKSQLIRFNRICTRQEDFMTAVQILFRALKKRGYCRSFLRNCFKMFRVRVRVRRRTKSFH